MMRVLSFSKFSSPNSLLKKWYFPLWIFLSVSHSFKLQTTLYSFLVFNMPNIPTFCLFSLLDIKKEGSFLGFGSSRVVGYVTLMFKTERKVSLKKRGEKRIWLLMYSRLLCLFPEKSTS